MSAKEQFLKKLQSMQAPAGCFKNQAQADIAEFRQSMVQLQDNIGEWLEGTGIEIRSFTVSLNELLISEGAFTLTGVALCYGNRIIKFTPAFLYGQSVTGCVDVTLYHGVKPQLIYRLFMRSSDGPFWTYSIHEGQAGHRRPFDEETFFSMIGCLLA
ncbi:hypothetical protein [Scandinavium sp.]|uniref:hypothetical protein n=1 Tax=Scandinavium sp. TaxID=2830653 RepID=UPI00289CDF75|nr:hypothetical protein [Scandinavium sp.]